MERAAAEGYLKRIGKLKVLVIGDTIIDKYVFVRPKGRAIKDPILSVGYVSHESYAGGILAIANHLSDFVDSITLVTLLGDEDIEEEFIKRSLPKNVTFKPFTKPGAPTTKKKRFIDSYRNNKLFKIEYMNDRPISDALTEELLASITEEAGKHDLVVVGDFGHGFLNQKLRQTLCEFDTPLHVNVQSNSSNMGYNYVTQYATPDFLSMDEEELRLPLMRRFEPVEEVVTEFHERFGHPLFLVTVGKKGAIVCEGGSIYKAPAFTTDVVDTVGAGDALFAISSLFVAAGLPARELPLIANAAGAIKVRYMGNKESITKEKLLSYLDGLKGKDA